MRSGSAGRARESTPRWSTRCDRDAHRISGDRCGCRAPRAAYPPRPVSLFRDLPRFRGRDPDHRRRASAPAPRILAASKVGGGSYRSDIPPAGALRLHARSEGATAARPLRQVALQRTTDTASAMGCAGAASTRRATGARIQRDVGEASTQRGRISLNCRPTRGAGDALGNAMARRGDRCV